jgi:hypothetical protein
MRYLTPGFVGVSSVRSVAPGSSLSGRPDLIGALIVSTGMCRPAPVTL